MASSKQVLLLLAAVAAVACLASSPASATVWVVGDDEGWRPLFNETGWANGKTFVVGDSLTFKYDAGRHTVAMVGKEAFETCDLSARELGYWNSGNDVVPAYGPGKLWFICTKPNHCQNGMKLAVDVVAAATGAPAPSPQLAIPGDDDVPAPAPAPSPWFRFPFPPWEPAPAPAPVQHGRRLLP